MSDEVVVEDFGGGCLVVTKRLPGETDKQAKRRYVKYLWSRRRGVQVGLMLEGGISVSEWLGD